VNHLDRSNRHAATGAWPLNKLAALVLLGWGALAHALPTDGVVTAGQAQITPGAGSMLVQQTSQNAAINWQSFNIAAGEAVRFVQPNAQSVALNRVLSSDPSRILGQLSANGQVFLINPNGVLFGQGAVVNVGGLVASTLGLSDADFMAGRYRFAGDSRAEVRNQGRIQADGGHVTLLGARVANEGVIQARLGSVSLAAGQAMTLDLAGDGLIQLTVNRGVADALVDNSGRIQADGGRVLLSAQAAGEVLSSVVNNTGVIQAQTIEHRHGEIRLMGGMVNGTVHAGGVLDASAPQGGDGGFVETSAAHLQLDPALRVDTTAPHGKTGRWLVDPVNFTIAASGGDITGAQLATMLASSNVTIQTSAGTNSASLLHGSTAGAGDIFVNDTVSWSANQLTLDAWRHIEFNAPLNVSGSASLLLAYGQGQTAAGNTARYVVNAPINLSAGSGFSTKQGSDGVVRHYTVINSLGASGSNTGADLQGIEGDLTGAYVLGSDIDASATAGWNAGAGFMPIGQGAAFSGVFDGLGHTITGLSINRPGTDYVGLFATTNAAEVRHLHLAALNVTGHDFVGAVVGRANGSTLRAVHALDGDVSGSNNVGGLSGLHDGNAVERSHASVRVHGVSNVGGLVGFAACTVNESYATGDVLGSYSVGGLTGASVSVIQTSYATGNVSGDDYVGGLTGYTNHWVHTTYATGAVTGTGNQVGGLIGHNGASVFDSYATGAVVGGGPDVGGLAGYSDYLNIRNSFWDVTRSGQATTAGGARGMSTADMQRLANFTSATTANGQSNPGWNMSSVWIMYDGHDSPLLRTFMTPLTVTVNNASKTYDGQAWSGTPSVRYSATPDSRLLGSVSVTDMSSRVNAGSYAMSAQGLYSGQQGYAITYVPGTLTIDRATVTLAASKTYDGSADLAHAVTVGTGVAGESLTYSGALASDPNVGTPGKYIQSLTLLDGAGGLASNYRLPTLDAAHAPVTITAAPLTVTADDASRLYGEANPPWRTTITGFVHGEDLASAGVTGQASVATSATDDSLPGVYDIVLARGDLSAPNYTFSTLLPGRLTVRSRLPAPDVSHAVASALVLTAAPQASLASPASALPASTGSGGASAEPAVAKPGAQPAMGLTLPTGMGLSIVDQGIRLPLGL